MRFNTCSTPRCPISSWSSLKISGWYSFGNCERVAVLRWSNPSSFTYNLCFCLIRAAVFRLPLCLPLFCLSFDGIHFSISPITGSSCCACRRVDLVILLTDDIAALHSSVTRLLMITRHSQGSDSWNWTTACLDNAVHHLRVYNLGASLNVFFHGEWHLGKICISVHFARAILYWELEISKFTNPSMSCCIQFSCTEHTCKTVVVCVNSNCWGIIEIISKPLTYGPLQSQELQLSWMKTVIFSGAVSILDLYAMTASFPCCLW